MVLVAPVPLAVTPAPTKLRVVASVDNALPSSCTVIAPLPPPIPRLAGVIFFITPPSSTSTKSASPDDVVVVGASELVVEINVPVVAGRVNVMFPLKSE